MGNLLDKIGSPADLKNMKQDELAALSCEIREFLIEKVGKSGGHLASNLGVVELSLALHRVFDSPKDHIIFDVGHQAYIHKIITGRKDSFDMLRVPGGLSGFTLRSESEHDPFGAGHSSTSVSAALGFAESDRLKGSDAYTVAVIGDGAYTGGMVHEAINNCKPDLKLIIVLNENGMSISSNTGAFASYLSRVRASKGYLGMKKRTDSFLSKIPLIGKPIRAALSFIKNLVKKLIFKPNYFEQLGFYYIGPIDGNDLEKVEKALTEAKDTGKCVIVHLKTTKGKGLADAEMYPEEFHSVSHVAPESTFHSECVDELISLAEGDETITAITAAMGVGTGLSRFSETFPDRYFDVGIAEEHALTFAAGLAANGMKPYAAIYSTFLQRAYDNILHDVAIQNLPCKMLIDRAGISVGDGVTHHGIFDVSFLSSIPGVEIIAPISYASLRSAVRYANEVTHPIAIRYPNSSESTEIIEHFRFNDSPSTFDFRCDFDVNDPPKRLIVTYGRIALNTIRAKELLSSDGIDVGIILAERLKPSTALADFIKTLSPEYVLFVEEGIKNGGFSMILASGLDTKCDIAAIDDTFLVPDTRVDIYDYAGLSAEKIREYFLR